MAPRSSATADIAEVVAEREYKRGDGETVRVVLGRPHADRRDWACSFQILGVGDDSVYTAFGVDGIQALRMALQMMAAQLSDYRQQHDLTFLGDADLMI